MGKRRKLCFWLGFFSVCLIIAGLFCFFSQNQKLLSLQRSQKGGFDKTQYLFLKQREVSVLFNLNLTEGVFVNSARPPFLVSVKSLATLNEDHEINEDNESDEAEAFNKNNEIKDYIVQQKDTLSSVGQKFGISVDTILWVNNLDKNFVIKPGQKLIILPVSGVAQLVRQGDTLSALAKKYKGEIQEIVVFNQLADENDIFAGDFLIIPNGKMPARTSAKITEATLLTDIPLAESYFIFPTEGEITQGEHSVLGRAVDIANKCGTPVVAAASGKVQRAGDNGWPEGKRIAILHPNGAVSYYVHLSSILTQPGQEVAVGEIIGHIGNTGYTMGTTGCHLHFEIRGAKNFLTEYKTGSQLKWGSR
jgi:murein DD-endopeptidase MepM/ murein hydrolase activator NlpD